MTNPRIAGLSKMLGPATGTSGAFSGAKLHVDTALVQLAGYGYAWTEIAYDTDSYVAHAGDFVSGTDYFDAAATVFRIPTRAVYRVSAGMLLSTTDGTSTATLGGVLSFLTMNEQPDFSFNELTNTIPTYWTGAVNNMGWAQNTWEGILDPDIDQMIGHYSLVSPAGHTHDKILLGSWMTIHRLGEVT